MGYKAVSHQRVHAVSSDYKAPREEREQSVTLRILADYDEITMYKEQFISVLLNDLGLEEDLYIQDVQLIEGKQYTRKHHGKTFTMVNAWYTMHLP